MFGDKSVESRPTLPADWGVVAGLSLAAVGFITYVAGSYINSADTMRTGVEMLGAGSVIALLAAPFSNLR